MSPFSKTLLIVLVFSLTFVFLHSSSSNAQRQAIETFPFQERERSIVKKTDFSPPVLIKAAKTKGRSVPLSERFTDDEDWLKGFAILVRNLSDKTITHVGVELLFPPVSEAQKLPAGWSLNYGPNPFHYKTSDAVPRSTVPIVLPGGEMEVKLRDPEFDDLMKFLKKAGFPTNLHVVEVRVTSIGFDDGTAWFNKMLRREPNGDWIPVDTVSQRLHHLPQLLANSPAGSFFFTD